MIGKAGFGPTALEERYRRAGLSAIAALPREPLFLGTGTFPGLDGLLPVTRADLRSIAAPAIPYTTCVRGRFVVTFEYAPDPGENYWRLLGERLAPRTGELRERLRELRGGSATPTEARYRAGLFLHVLGDAAEARATLEAAASHWPPEPGMLAIAESFATLLGDFDTARTLVERASRGQDSAEDRARVALARARTGERDRAMEGLASLAKSPGWVLESDYSHDLLGELLPPAETARHLALVNSDEVSPDGLVRLALCWLLAADDRRRARAALGKLFRWRWPLVLVGRPCWALEMALGDRKRARDLAEKALTLVDYARISDPIFSQFIDLLVIVDCLRLTGARARAALLLERCRRRNLRAEHYAHLIREEHSLLGPRPDHRDRLLAAERIAESHQDWVQVGNAWNLFGDAPAVARAEAAARAAFAREEAARDLLD